MDTDMLTRRAAIYLMRLLPLEMYGRMVPREVMGLCYHVVSDEALPHVRHLYPSKNVAQFEADLVFMKRHLRPVSHAQVLEARAAGRPLPAGSVHLSFDDGYAECFHVVRPLLLKHGIPCTFFITTGVLDNVEMLAFNKVSLSVEAMEKLAPAELASVLHDASERAGVTFRSLPELTAWMRRAIRDPDSGGAAFVDALCERVGVDPAAFLAESRPYMTRDEVRQLADEGFTIGGHTRFHWQMGRTRGNDRVEHEIVESCRIAKELGAPDQVPFAFPYDASGVDRGFLADLLLRHPSIGPLFGAHGLQQDAPFLINRMLADAPPRIGRARSNLGGLIAGGYLEEVLRRDPAMVNGLPTASATAAAAAALTY